MSRRTRGPFEMFRKRGVEVVLATVACLLAFGCEVDRCLDHGGRWNDALSVCEFDSSPLPDAEPER